MGFLQNFMHHVNPAAGCEKPSQNHSRKHPKPSPDPPKTLQNRGQMRPGELRCPQEWFNGAQKVPQSCPRGAQEVPKSAQEAPKSSRRATKTRPGDAQTHPKSSPARPRTSFQRNLRVKCLSESVWTDFLSFFVLRATCAMCDPHNKNCGFCTIRALSSCALADTKKHEKNFEN